MEKVDVVIAGAGIAGCLAARDLAAKGWSVVLLERRSRDHMGHDWWDAVKEEVFEEVGMPVPAPPERMAPNAGIKMMTPLETMAIEADYPEGKFHVDRKLLAARQLKYAEEAGAKIMFHTAVHQPILENGALAGVISGGPGGERKEISARLTIDATGFSAAIRRHIPENEFFPRYVSRGDSFATYREIRETSMVSRENLVTFGKNNGVCWINRSQEGLVDFFAGALNYPGRVSPRKIVEELIGKTPDAGQKVVRGGYGAPIPVRRCFDAFVYPGFMLCGDSACQCNPIDGSGMASSLRAAKIAAATAHAALSDGRLDVAALWPYVAAYKRTQGAAFVPFDAIQKFLISEPPANLELLFVRKIIGASDFWGTGEAKNKSTLDQLKKLVKLIDKPAFMVRLVRGMGAAKKIAAHFKEFPENYSPESFRLWRDKSRSILSCIPPKM